MIITRKQRKAVDNMVENGGIASKAMRDAGYSENTAKTPQKLTESGGFKAICEEYGLTDGLILKSLVEDIKKKPQNRKPELELGSKITGLLDERPRVEINLPAPIYGSKSISIPGHNGNQEDIQPDKEN
jgi:hypothetical protein